MSAEASMPETINSGVFFGSSKRRGYYTVYTAQAKMRKDKSGYSVTVSHQEIAQRLTFFNGEGRGSGGFSPLTRNVLRSEAIGGLEDAPFIKGDHTAGSLEELIKAAQAAISRKQHTFSLEGAQDAIAAFEYEKTRAGLTRLASMDQIPQQRTYSRSAYDAVFGSKVVVAPA